MPTKKEKNKIVITEDGGVATACFYNGDEIIKSVKVESEPDDIYDLIWSAETLAEKLDAESTEIKVLITEKEQNQKPLQMYCIESYEPGTYFTKGKTYEWHGTSRKGSVRSDDGFMMHDLNFLHSLYHEEKVYFKDIFVPLVKRPAKVGEYVYITNGNSYPANRATVEKVEYICRNGKLVFKEWSVGADDHLALDGYRGESVKEQ